MKDKTSEIEKLGDLLDNVNLNDSSTSCEGVSDLKCSNLVYNVVVKDEPGSSFSEDEDNVCFDGLKSLKTSSKVKQESSSEDENSEKSSEQEGLRKRGGLRKAKTTNHTSTPYQGKRIVTKQLERVSSSTENRAAFKLQFFSGGGFVPSEIVTVQEFSPGNSEALIPDLAQLLGENFTGSVETQVNIDQFHLDENDISDDTVKKFIDNNEALPDLGISDLFLDILDPQNDPPQSLSSGSEIPDSSLEDQLLSNSPDNGYISASPDNTYPESPASFSTSTVDLSLCASPSSSSLSCPSPSSSSNGSSQIQSGKKKRNPFLEGLDAKLCEKYHRAILKKARENEGLNQKDNKNGTLLHLAIEQKNEVYAIVMLNMLQKSFQNEPRKIIIPNFPK